MNKTILSLLCLPLFAQQIPYEVEEEMQVSVHLLSSLVMELDEIGITMEQDGEERELPAPERSLVVTNSNNLSFTDTISNLNATQPHQIAREFTKILVEQTQTINAEGKEASSTDRIGTSIFEEQTVRFVTDDDGEWSASVDGDEDFDDALLAELSIHFGFRDFLPESMEVSVGDTWEVPLDAFEQIRAPAGLLAIEYDTGSRFPGFRNQFAENLEGTIQAECKAWDEEQGLLEIALTCELSTIREDGLELAVPGAEGEQTRHSELALQLEGELLWDLDTGFIKSIRLEGDLQDELRITQTIRPDEADFEERTTIQTMSLSGTLIQELTVD